MATELPTSMGIKKSSSLMLAMYLCMYVARGTLSLPGGTPGPYQGP